MTERAPWDRQPRESSPAFQAFQTYLDLGPSRSLAAVGQKLGKSRSLLSRWSAHWHWQDRLAAYESELGRKAMEAEAEEREEARRYYIRGSRQLADRALLRLLGNEEQGYRPLDVNSLTAADVVRLWEAGLRGERLAHGESTENVEIRSARAEVLRMAAAEGLSEEDTQAALEEVDRIFGRR
jgi:hypothetical protein